jgi:prevent-host-death family protein
MRKKKQTMGTNNQKAPLLKWRNNDKIMPQNNSEMKGRFRSMMDIRPVSDLRNKFTEIERTVKRGKPVYLTKNGYGSMVVLSLEQYSALTDDVEMKLDEADKEAALTDVRYTEEEVFQRVKERIHGRKTL